MKNITLLKSYGLFDSKVPRYTSFPPANRFGADVGRRHQRQWLATLPPDEPVSLYVHIPFCRRLCWFCACRTQGTRTRAPLDEYVTHLLAEIRGVLAHTPTDLRMGRLHLGGGTPTLLNAQQMNRLLDAIFSNFPTAENFEFSVEVDPTEASDEVLDALAAWHMSRASIGVQDFDSKVQEAIGRPQTIAQTEDTIARLRRGGIHSLNIDLLYGLPFQSGQSLTKTLDTVVALKPDRIALYGYAHVPHMSKRQVMIPSHLLPSPLARYRASHLAADRLTGFGYRALGIDHFALPTDSLAKAAAAGQMRRNFQGYTDDPCSSLIGFGASAISKFAQGYVQNAVATAAYQQRITSEALAGHKGYQMGAVDLVIADMINGLMCNGAIDFNEMQTRFPFATEQLVQAEAQIKSDYANVFSCKSGGLTVRRDCLDLTRLIAASLDTGLHDNHVHSAAI